MCIYMYVCIYIYDIYIIWIQKPSWCQEELPGAQQRAGRPQTFGERLVNLNGQRGSPQLLAPILGPKARHFKLWVRRLVNLSLFGKRKLKMPLWFSLALLLLLSFLRVSPVVLKTKNLCALFLKTNTTLCCDHPIKVLCRPVGCVKPQTLSSTFKVVLSNVILGPPAALLLCPTALRWGLLLLVSPRPRPSGLSSVPVGLPLALLPRLRRLLLVLPLPPLPFIRWALLWAVPVLLRAPALCVLALRALLRPPPPCTRASLRCPLVALRLLLGLHRVLVRRGLVPPSPVVPGLRPSPPALNLMLPNAALWKLSFRVVRKPRSLALCRPAQHGNLTAPFSAMDLLLRDLRMLLLKRNLWFSLHLRFFLRILLWKSRPGKDLFSGKADDPLRSKCASGESNPTLVRALNGALPCLGRGPALSTPVGWP